MPGKDLTYKPIIGMEIHIELKTESKMFCRCKADYFGKEPNTRVCPTCLGLPGALPYPNSKAVEWCLMLGLALDCSLNKESFFERKNYFYPDLPKGYQISQYNKPFCQKGELALTRGTKVRINRVHLEEDTGKLIHSEDFTLIDFNRSGVPLVEIVSEPDLTSPDEIVEYGEKIQEIVRYLGISDADMEKGTMRLEPTVNLRIEENKEIYFTPLVELKNINSFRFAKRAVEYEIERQLDKFKHDRRVKDVGNKTTRGYDEDEGITIPQREKEEANDYRYFPEPDIPPFSLTDEEIESIKIKIPELPAARLDNFMKKYSLSQKDARILTRETALSRYFEKTAEIAKTRGLDTRTIANWLVNKRINVKSFSPAELVETILQKTKVKKMAQGKLDEIVTKIINQNPRAVEDYRKGKNEALGFLIGQAKRMDKEINPELVKQAVIEAIGKANA